MDHFLGTQNIRCRTILRIQKGTIVLTTTHIGIRIRGTLRDIDPLSKLPFKKARSRVYEGFPLRGLPDTP